VPGSLHLPGKKNLRSIDSVSVNHAGLLKKITAASLQRRHLGAAHRLRWPAVARRPLSHVTRAYRGNSQRSRRHNFSGLLGTVYGSRLYPDGHHAESVEITISFFSLLNVWSLFWLRCVMWITTDPLDRNEFEECCRPPLGSPPNKYCFNIDVPANDEFFSRFGVRCIDFVRGFPGVRHGCRLGRFNSHKR
jgi:hypothetical protein